MGNQIAKAYVQIVPSAEGISGSISSVLSPEATSAGLLAGTAVGGGVLQNMKGILTGVGVTAAIAGVVKALKDCVGSASEFDASMSQVAATMGTSTDQISQLTDFAKEMGRTTAFSAQEAADGLNTLALAGLSADEQMAVLPNVMNLASAGCLSLDSAASYVTGTIKGFGDSMDNAEYYTDLMAKGATLANTDVNSLGEALSGSAATAASYGQEADSVTLALLRLAEQNVTGSEATTALTRAMADLYTPTDAAKSALEDLGVACYDESGTARDFNDVCDDLAFALSGMDDETRKAYEDTIFTTQGMKAFDKMTSASSETVDGFKEALADCEGSAMQQAETQLDNLQGDMTLFGSAMDGLKIAVGEALTPMCRDIVQFGTDAVTVFTDIITGEFDWQEHFCGVIDKCAEKMGITDWPGMGELINSGIGGGFSNLVQAVPGFMSDFVQTIDQKIQETDWHQVGYDLANKILGGLRDILSDIPGVISSITQNIVQFLKDVDWKQVGYDVMTYVLTGLKMIIVDIPQAIVEITQAIWDKIMETDWLELGGNIVKGIIQGLTEFLPEALSSIGDFCSGLVQGFKDFFGISSPSTLMEEQGGYLVDGLVQGMSDMPDAADEILQETEQNVEGFGKQSKLSMDETGQGMVANIGQKLSSLFGTVDSPLSQTFSNITTWGKNSKNNATDTGTGFVSNIKSGLSTLVSTIKSPMDTSLANTTAWGTNNTSKATDTANNFVTNMKSGLSSLANTVKSPMDTSFSNTKTWGTDMVDRAKSSGTDFVSRMKSSLSALDGKVKAELTNVTNSSKSWGSSLSSTFNTMGRNVMQGMINGIGGMVGSLYNSIYNSLSGLVSKAKGALGIGSPSKVFRKEIGEMIGEGLALGIDDSIGDVENSMDDLVAATAMSPMGSEFNLTGSASGGGPGAAQVNVTQNIYSQAKSAAQLMRECRREAQRAVMQGV